MVKFKTKVVNKFKEQRRNRPAGKTPVAQLTGLRIPSDTAAEFVRGAIYRQLEAKLTPDVMEVYLCDETAEEITRMKATGSNILEALQEYTLIIDDSKTLYDLHLSDFSSKEYVENYIILRKSYVALDVIDLLGLPRQIFLDWDMSHTRSDLQPATADHFIQDYYNYLVRKHPELLDNHEDRCMLHHRMYFSSFNSLEARRQRQEWYNLVMNQDETTS